MPDANAVNRSVTQEVDFQPVQHAEEQFRLAENENRSVVESKILVLLLLLGAGATLGVATFVTTTVAEDSEFRAQVCTFIILPNSVYYFPRTNNDFFISAYAIVRRRRVQHHQASTLCRQGCIRSHGILERGRYFPRPF
jgi:hypothetical protein